MRESVMIDAKEHVFDHGVLDAKASAETRRAVLAELLRWGMLAAEAERLRRQAEVAKLNWRASILAALPQRHQGYKVSEASRVAQVHARPEYPVIEGRFSAAEEAAKKADVIYDLLKTRAKMLVLLMDARASATQASRAIAAEDCEPGQQYRVGDQVLTFHGLGPNGALFRGPGGGETWVDPAAQVKDLGVGSKI
jgi:hypothetical protein